jgi:protein SCO1/2
VNGVAEGDGLVKIGPALKFELVNQDNLKSPMTYKGKVYVLEFFSLHDMSTPFA